MRLSISTAALFLVFCDTSLGDAGNSSRGVSEEEEIVVRATRLEKRIDEVPAAVSRVDKEDIQPGRQQIGLDESLSAVPGVFMQNRYNFAQDLRVSIRGFGARSAFGIRGIKILVDGIPVSLPDGQGQSDSIDLGSIESIEVVRGAASSLYGNASGGVIRITSERPSADPFVEARLSAGAYGFRKYQLKAGGGFGGLGYLLSYSELAFDGYRDHGETEQRTLNATLAYALDDATEFRVNINATDQPLADDPGSVTLSRFSSEPTSARQQNVAFDAGETLDQQRIGLVFIRAFADKHEFRVRNYTLRRDFSNRLPFESGGAVQLDRSLVGGGVSYTGSYTLLGRESILVAGADIDRQDDERRRFDNLMGMPGDLTFEQTEDVRSIGVFLQNETSLGERLKLTLGVRHDDVEFAIEDRFLADGDDSGERTLSETSPMFGVNFALSGSSNVYATVSTAFETPTATEFANPTGAGGLNPFIRPQLARNYELGIRGTLATRHRYELAIFKVSVEDELVPFETPAQPGRVFFNNAGKSSRDGLEFALSIEPVENLKVSLNYAYSDFVFDEFRDDTGTDFSGNTIPGIPRHLLRAEVRYDHHSGAYAAIDSLNVGDFYADNANSATNDRYSVVNARLGLADWTRNNWVLSPFVGINNLLDERYAGNVRINAFGGRYFEAAPDRHVYGGIAIRYVFRRPGPD